MSAPAVTDVTADRDRRGIVCGGLSNVHAGSALIYLPIAVDAEVVRRSQKASRHKFTTLS
jgi:hypothetical protein